jgi:hypothetical protein
MMPSDEEITKDWERRIEEGTELDDMVPVKARVPKNPRAVFSVRFAPEELGEVQRAADGRGVTIGELIRSSALAAARGQADYGFTAEKSLQDLGRRLRAASEEIERQLSKGRD